MSSAFVIRVALPADAESVTELLAASCPVLMAGAYDEAALKVALPAMTRAKSELLSSGTFYVAEADDGELAGCGGWTRERPGTGETNPRLAHIRHFATQPKWIGRGVGQALCNRCEEDARAAGISRFECHASLNAQGFYQALGFDTLRRFELAMGNGSSLPSILMQREL
ncbi:MAG: GNAT family N-acetyltransferase [Salaquimonas sp.]|nr:GNAT family N-acetyltransferase [Salaquimonas sp.]